MVGDRVGDDKGEGVAEENGRAGMMKNECQVCLVIGIGSSRLRFV
jgi:hypothetical protein